jgi:cysteine desulfurase family protein (TIGR01976 family)
MTHPHANLSHLRADFPSLHRQFNGHPLIYFDGPAGTQVPGHVIGALTYVYTSHNANTHGQFVTSHENDQMLASARRGVATFLGAKSASTISFGANMTSLAFALSRAFARRFTPGDEVIITALDHEANRAPWLALEERGIVVREVRLRPDGTLDEVQFRSLISPRTRLVAVGMASNLLGTVNNIALARELSSAVGAWLLLDAVHFAPHFLIDVEALQTDFLLCSAYKFYGPHVGILYAREGLLDQLEPDRLRTQDPRAPYRIETGTLNHAAIGGVLAAIEYIASIADGNSLRGRLASAFQHLGGHERQLASTLRDELAQLSRVTIYGPPFGDSLRAPTISFTMEGLTATEIAKRLAAKGICTWDGHFYAIQAVESLGLLEQGGLVRMGMALYNTIEEVHDVVAAVRGIA